MVDLSLHLQHCCASHHCLRICSRDLKVAFDHCRQFATLLRYFHYCQGVVNYDLPVSVMRTLLVSGVDGEEDAEIEKASIFISDSFMGL